MPYRIKCLRVKNFKCFDAQKYYRFDFNTAMNPVILSGPNGFGKTTFFDAIELIFTKNITRLHNDIEDKRINLGKNILLNEANKDGILVLELIDNDNKYLSILVVIDHHNEKLTISSSIKYSITNTTLASDADIESYINSVSRWNDTIDECIKLKYSWDHFNVYYYVSQAESVHFLKKQIGERKNSVNALLNTEQIEHWINDIESRLIGGTIQKKGVLINDAISSSKDTIEKKVTVLKDKLKQVGTIENSEYNPLLIYPSGISTLIWDGKDIRFNENETAESLNGMIREIEAIHYFAVNRSDYSVFLQNDKIRKLRENKAGINDFIEFSDYIESSNISVEKIRDIIAVWKQQVSIYNRSSFFRKNFDISLFKKDDLSQIKAINSSLILFDIDKIADTVDQIKKLQSEMSANQKLLGNLDNARSELHKHINVLDSEGTCPYCSHKFKSADDLERSFLELTKTISERKTEDSANVVALVKALHDELETSTQNILSFVKDLNESDISVLNLKAAEYQQFIDSTERLGAVKAIGLHYTPDGLWSTLDESGKVLHLERFLQEKMLPYNNPDFENMYDRYMFQKIAKQYENIFSLPQENLLDLEKVKQKIAYIEYRKSSVASAEIAELKKELKSEILRKHQLQNLRTSLDQLRSQYKSAIDIYRNQVIKKLRVPLLIYSGKILQDYQNGLGVFISKDEMRFVSNGDAKHDILNTFSSGQISGFVLAFLFAMNKQYITKSTDDIAFILVDDPVQTMDDINIASLIEVLRNDFADKQLILSTHETDKENYILYKFLKYNLKGESFNVKEELYR